eukprot:scaffold287_cov337-Pavlova_lutheri.AAC.5
MDVHCCIGFLAATPIHAHLVPVYPAHASVMGSLRSVQETLARVVPGSTFTFFSFCDVWGERWRLDRKA